MVGGTGGEGGAGHADARRSRVWSLALAWLAAYTVATAAVRGSSTGRQVLGQYAYDAAPLLAVVLTARAFRRVRGSFWALVATGTALYALGDVVYSAYPLLGGERDPFPSYADVGYSSGILVLLAAVLSGFRRAAGLRWARAGLDAALVAAGAIAVLSPLLVLDLPAGLTLAPLALATAYPVVGVTVLALWVSLGLAGHDGLPPALLLVSAAVASKAVGSAVVAYQEKAGSGYASGGWLDPFLQVAAVLLCVAAVTAAAPVAPARPVELRRDLGLAAGSCGVVATLLVVGRQAWDGQLSHNAVLLTGAVVGLLLVRMAVSSADARRVGLALDRAVADREVLAATDSLTGVANRRQLDGALRRRCEAAVRDGGELGLLVLDLDRFKAVNDSHGHPAGDAVLRQVADRLARAVRPGDVLARYGGEEFALVAPGAGRAALLELAHRLGDVLRATPVLLPNGTRLPVTASIGGACLPADALTPDVLLQVADDALYRAKAAGRDRTELGRAPVPGHAPSVGVGD